MNKVWLVTGGSKGIGLSLTKYLLENNQKVVTTSRNKEDLIKKIKAEDESFLPVSLDITDEKDIKRIVDATMKKFGQIDVLVNNAGYLMGGPVEEVSDKAAKECFDINVFGTLNMIRAVAPIMRNQLSGHILNTSSVSGIRSGTFEGIYGATKFAVNGISIALADELKPFNIHVTSILPGLIRTEFLENTSLVTVSTTHSPYKKDYEQRMGYAAQINGHQPGDPHKVAELYLKIVNSDCPPTEVMVGSDAYETALRVAKNTLENTEKYKEWSTSIDY